jgi:hypothetical protein
MREAVIRRSSGLITSAVTISNTELDRLQSELQNIAVRYRELSAGTKARLRSQPVLLALRRIKRDNGKREGDNTADLDHENDWEEDLKRAGEIVIADNAIAYRVFAGSIWAAPEDDLLEGNVVQSRQTLNIPLQ